jgi:hypothetical protein
MNVCGFVISINGRISCLKDEISRYHSNDKKMFRSFPDNQIEKRILPFAKALIITALSQRLVDDIRYLTAFERTSKIGHSEEKFPWVFI